MTYISPYHFRNRNSLSRIEGERSKFKISVICEYSKAAFLKILPKSEFKIANHELAGARGGSHRKLDSLGPKHHEPIQRPKFGIPTFALFRTVPGFYRIFGYSHRHVLGTHHFLLVVCPRYHLDNIQRDAGYPR